MDTGAFGGDRAPGFLNFRLPTFGGGGVVLVGSRRPGCRRTFSSDPELHPLNASGTPAPAVTTQNVCRCCHVSPGGQTEPPQVRSQGSRTGQTRSGVWPGPSHPVYDRCPAQEVIRYKAPRQGEGTHSGPDQRGGTARLGAGGTAQGERRTRSGSVFLLLLSSSI